MKRVLFALLLPSVAWAGPQPPSVAVMPFKDLSGAKGNVGEAIRETVTTDLKDVPGLRVIERGHIDKILAEQNLQSSKADLDPTTTVKVGKLLGASLIVTGAYQKAGSNVRLTARFVKVETGEITGTAKVDGGQSDFLVLQDRVTTELLKSAGIEQKHVQKFASRARPKLKSLKTVELYGDAVIETDDGKKKELLLASLNEDPSFVYATRDLDALEKRLKQYDAAAANEQKKALKELKETIANEKDPQKLNMHYTMLFAKLMTQKRWKALIVQARAIQENPPPPPPMQMVSLEEMAGMYIVTACQTLKDDDCILREGERFVARYPASMYMQSVRLQLDQAIDRKRQANEGMQKVNDELAKMDPKERADLWRVATVHKNNGQLKEARRLFETCLSTKCNPYIKPGLMMFMIIMCSADLGDFATARKWAAQIEKEDPEQYRTVKTLATMWPAD